MKRRERFIVLIVWFLFLSITGFSQTVDTSLVFRHARSVPFTTASTTEQLSQYLAKPFTTDAQKVLAFAYWISTNISHSLSYYDASVSLPQQILSEKEANAEGFAVLFAQLCAHQNIPAEIVHGYVRDFDFLENDEMYRSNHAWSLVKYNGRWHIYDVAFASGTKSFTPQTNFLIPLKTVENPYTSHRAFVKKFNPQWFAVNPQTAIETHFPLVPMFQLLRTPISLSHFKMGPMAVRLYISNSFELNVRNTAIDRFYALDAVKKNVAIAEDAFAQNIANNFDRAWFCARALEVYRKEHYIPETNRLFARFTILRPMREYATYADTFFTRAQTDIAAEFQLLRSRTDTWRRTLIQQNKDFVRSFQNLNRQNNAHISTLSRADALYSTMTDFVRSQKNRHIPSDITQTLRPLVNRNADMYERVHLLLAVDSISEVITGLLTEFTRLSHTFSLQQLQDIIEQEKKNVELYKQCSTYVNLHVSHKQASAPLVYMNMDEVQKPSLQKNIQKLDSISETVRHTIVTALTKKQQDEFEMIKQYVRLSHEQFRMVKEAKKKSFVDVKEDSIFIAIVQGFEKQLDTFIEHIRISQQNTALYLTVLRQPQSIFSHIITLLREEERLESHRHSSYVQYITEQRNILQVYVSESLRDIRNVQKLIHMALE